MQKDLLNRPGQGRQHDLSLGSPPEWLPPSEFSLARAAQGSPISSEHTFRVALVPGLSLFARVKNLARADEVRALAGGRMTWSVLAMRAMLQDSGRGVERVCSRDTESRGSRKVPGRSGSSGGLVWTGQEAWTEESVSTEVPPGSMSCRAAAWDTGRSRPAPGL